jgi:hypothetical protein
MPCYDFLSEPQRKTGMKALRDYAPGQTVTITGSGWQPGETVTLTLEEVPNVGRHPAPTAVADANGRIFNNQFKPDQDDVNIRFLLTATALHSRERTTLAVRRL